MEIMLNRPEHLLDKLRSACHIVVLTGSGISAESGVPTFRDAQTGLWAQFEPEQLATPEAFEENPQRALDWYAWRRELISRAEPNAGHLAIARIQELVPELILITQNVDGLHQRAGSRDVIELHGNIFRMKCFNCNEPAPDWDKTNPSQSCCKYCGGLLRPDVVWFGEALSDGTYGAAKEAVRNCDLFMSIGTSSQVYPAAVLPFEAVERGATVVQINPNATPLNDVTPFNFMGKAGEVLPKLVKAVWGK